MDKTRLRLDMSSADIDAQCARLQIDRVATPDPQVTLCTAQMYSMFMEVQFRVHMVSDGSAAECTFVHGNRQLFYHFVDRMRGTRPPQDPQDASELRLSSAEMTEEFEVCEWLLASNPPVGMRHMAALAHAGVPVPPVLIRKAAAYASDPSLRRVAVQTVEMCLNSGCDMSSVHNLHVVLKAAMAMTAEDGELSAYIGVRMITAMTLRGFCGGGSADRTALEDLRERTQWPATQSLLRDLLRV